MPDRLVWAVACGLSLGSAALAQEEGHPVQLADRGPAFFSVASPGAVRIDVRDATLLRSVVALDVVDVSVSDALRAIERAASVHIVYTADLIPAGARVTVEARRISLGGALTTVLQDVPVDVEVGAGGVLTLARRGGAVVVPVMRRRQAAGTIGGRVTDSATGRGIESATVSLEATSWRTLTDTSGAFTLRNVRPGTYRLTARLLGYRPTVRTITLGADSIVRADLVLAKSVSRLDEVVTTGTMVPTEVKALPTPVTVISDSDIARQRPSTVQELLRQAVPTAVSWNYPSAPYITDFSVRGASTLSGSDGQLKIFVDGVDAADRAQAPVDPATIERIEVIRGPQAAAIYGSDAIGGVIQIFTKRGDPTLTRPQVAVEAGVGALQTPYAGVTPVRQNYTASVTGGASAVGYYLGGGYSHTGDYIPNGELSAQSSHSLSGGMHFARGIMNVAISGRYYAEDDPATFNPALIQTGLAFYSKPFLEPTQNQNQTVGITVGASPTSWWHHTITLGLDQSSQELIQARRRLTTASDTLFTVSSLTYDKRLIRYNTTLQAPLGSSLSGSLTAGVDHYDLPVTGFFTTGALNTTGNIQLAGGRSIGVSRTTTTNTGYFAQGQLGLQDALFLTAGIRGERNTNFGDAYGTALAPRVGLSYTQQMTGATLKFRGSWGRAIRAPFALEKLAFVGATSVRLANPQLGPERQQGWDAGVDAVWASDASLGVTYYDQIADNLIDLVDIQSTSVPRTNQWQNIGRVRNTGVELEGTEQIGLLALKAQYGYARARVEQLSPTYTGPQVVGDQVLATPRHTAGASATVALLKGTSVAAGVTYVGSWTNNDVLALYSCFGNTGPCRPTSRDYLIAFPGLVKVNTTVSQQLTRVVSGFVSIDNLTNNQRYENGNDEPVFGRTSTVGMRLRY